MVCGQDEDINAAIQKLEKLANRETRMAVAVTHQDVKQILKRQEDTRGKPFFVRIPVELRPTFSLRGSEQELRSKIYEWLSPPDPHTNHDFNRTLRRGQTGDWFLQTPELLAWRDGDNHNPLWLHGIRASFVLSPYMWP